jgi:hypothetical protein
LTARYLGFLILERGPEPLLVRLLLLGQLLYDLGELDELARVALLHSAALGVWAKEGFTRLSQLWETVVNQVLVAGNVGFSYSLVLVDFFVGHTVVVESLFGPQVLEVVLLPDVDRSLPLNLLIGVLVFLVHSWRTCRTACSFSSAVDDSNVISLHLFLLKVNLFIYTQDLSS